MSLSPRVSGTVFSASERRCYALDLVNDAELITAYEKRHQPGNVWPEILSDMKDRGIVSMEIWRCDDRLFMITENDPTHPAQKEIPPLVQQWEAEMDHYQCRLPGSAENENGAP